MPLLRPSRYAELHIDVNAATRPVTALESSLAAEITYATWELERVRANTANPNYEQAKPRPNAACAHATRLSPHRRKTAAVAPLPKLAGPILNHALDLVQSGGLSPNALNIVTQQETR